MTIKEINAKIMSDEKFVLRELDTLITYYQLKHTMRWAHTRTEDETESVAEHIYGMHILIDYFYPLIAETEPLNLETIRHLATWHDMAEAFVGDMPTRTKTDEHKQDEKQAEAEIVKNAPAHLATLLKDVFAELDVRLTREAAFVKAIDKIEPNVHLYFLSQKEKDYAQYLDLGWTAEAYRTYREPYMSPFPLIQKFDEVLYVKSKETNFFPLE
ncbi:MAG: HD domain-containing protein [Patescibacteria group bacterium]